MTAIPKSLASSVLIVAALLATACSKPSLPTETTVEGATSTAPSTAAAKQEHKTLLRFINATGSPKDLYFQDEAAFRKVESAAVTPYVALLSPRGDAHHQLKLYDSTNPTGKPLISDSEPETTGHRYTVLALEKGGKFTFTVIPDQLKLPAAGKAKVRSIHTAPGSDFGHFTEYKEIAPSNELQAGKLYTIVVFGSGPKLIEDEFIQ